VRPTVDGAGQTRLTTDRAKELGAAWSPDGTKIAFLSFRDLPAARNVYIMNADGSDPHPVQPGGSQFVPAWQPPSRGIRLNSSRVEVRQVGLEHAFCPAVLARQQPVQPLVAGLQVAGRERGERRPGPQECPDRGRADGAAWAVPGPSGNR
jgi:hypothetical protein